MHSLQNDDVTKFKIFSRSIFPAEACSRHTLKRPRALTNMDPKPPFYQVIVGEDSSSSTPACTDDEDESEDEGEG